MHQEKRILIGSPALALAAAAASDLSVNIAHDDDLVLAPPLERGLERANRAERRGHPLGGSPKRKKRLFRP